MKIALYTDAYKPQINGVVTSVELLASSLRKLGNKVIIITPNDPEAEPEFGVIRIPSAKFLLAPQFRMSMVYSQRTLNRLKRIKPDIIHCHTEFSMGIFAKLTGMALNLPVVYTYHTLYEHYTHYISKTHFKRQSRHIALQITKFYTQNCDNLIVPTKKVRDALESYGITRTMHIIPTGLDIGMFDRSLHSDAERAKLREKYGIAKDDFLFLYLGRISYEKSIDLLIKTFTKLNILRSKFLIVGNGPELANLQKLAIYNKNIIFTGPVAYDEVPLFYQASDAFLNASVSETQGLTFIEAMASGALLLVRADDSLKEMLTKNNSAIIYDSVDELEKNMCEIAANPAKFAEIRENAIESAQKYSVDTYGESAAAVYEETLRNAPRVNKNRSTFANFSLASWRYGWKYLRNKYRGLYKQFSRGNGAIK